MKNIYLNPEITVEIFDDMNILTTSATDTDAMTMAMNDLSAQDLDLTAVFAMK